MLISLERVVGLVKVVQKFSKINQQNGFSKKKWSINGCFFGCLMMHHSCLCDSAKNISSKLLFQVVSKNILGQSVYRFFQFLICWKLFENPCFLWLGILISSQCCFKIESAQLIFYANSLVALYMNKAVCFGISWTFIYLYLFSNQKTHFYKYQCDF